MSKYLEFMNSTMGHTHMQLQAALEIKALQQRNAELEHDNQALECKRDEYYGMAAYVGGIMEGSQGVAGWHLNGEIAEWDELFTDDAYKQALAKRDIEQQIKGIDGIKENCNLYMAFPTDKMIARECITVEEVDAYHWALKKQLRKGGDE
jgi:hypothetical protein